MDLQVSYQYQKFCKCFGTPTDSICCKSLPLRAGMVVVCVLDIIIGVLCLIELGLTLFGSNRDSQHGVILTLIADVLAISALPFAVICLQGISVVSQPKIHIYSWYKRVEVFVLASFTIMYFSVTCEEQDLGCDIVSMTVVGLVRTAFNFYFAYVVWSADVRLANNETVLVMHGRDVIQLMQQQAIAGSPRSAQVAQAGEEVPYGTPLA